MLLTAFSHFIVVFLSAVFLLLPARPGEVVLTVTPEPDALRVEYVNRTNRAIETGGDRFLLEKEVAGQWEPVPFREGFSFPEIGHTVPPTRGGTFTIQPERAFADPLSPGRYRLTFFYDCLTTEGGESAATEFDLT